MDGVNLSALISYVLITTFTPGPNNISSAAMAANYGLRRTLGYLLGISTGFFLLLLLSGSLSAFVMRTAPAIEPYMRWVGACYILWLAWGLARSAHADDGTVEVISRGFLKGILLQFVNPKGVIYSISLYTAFLGSILSSIPLMVLCAVSLSVIVFVAVLTWALFGVAINRAFRSPGKRLAVNYVLALLLVYTALTVAGLL